jgi:hypothetical protein
MLWCFPNLWVIEVEEPMMALHHVERLLLGAKEKHFAIWHQVALAAPTLCSMANCSGISQWTQCSLLGQEEVLLHAMPPTRYCMAQVEGDQHQLETCWVVALDLHHWTNRCHLWASQVLCHGRGSCCERDQPGLTPVAAFSSVS